MCKAPIKGKVKTRLMTQYSAQEAMQWHMAMATTVIERAIGLFKHVTLAVDDIQHEFFKQFDVALCAQGEGDLGERMQGLMMARAVSNRQAIMFIGTDSPHMLDQRLIDATKALTQVDVVLGAVEDGGYDLIAINAVYPELFSGIDWGSDKVLQQSVDIARKLQLSYQLLETSFDVDTPDMIERARLAGWAV